MQSMIRTVLRRSGGSPTPLAALAAGVALAVLALSAREGSAATLVYRTDAQLVALSDRIVHGRVLDVRSEWAPGRRTIYTVARIAVLEDLTGLTDPVIEVRELGGSIDGVQMWVPGAPVFVPGTELVLALERVGARWRTVAMEFSTFHVSPAPGGDLTLTRHTLESNVIGAPAVESPSRLLSQLRALAAGIKRVQPVRPGGERFVAEAGDPVSAPFTLLADMRWRQADTDTVISWRRNPSAPSPMTGGGNVDTQIQTAVAAWTTPASSRISLTFGGQLNIGADAPDCGDTFLGGGLITFEDPFNEISGSTIAIGGGCSTLQNHMVNGHSFAEMTHGFVLFNNAAELSPGIREPQNFLRVLTHEIGHGIGLGHTCDNSAIPCTVPMQSNLMFPSCCSTATPTPPAIGPDDLAGIVFIYPMPAAPPPPPPPPADTDTDGMPDGWETDFGLDPGANDAGADPDGDGLTNLQEYQNGSHPRGFEKRYFAEGVANAFFETQIALLNSGGPTEAKVLLRLQPQSGSEKSHYLKVPAGARRTITTATLTGLTTEPFSTLVESDVPVIADRTVSWGGGYGSHTETAVLQPATTWYLAEGATGGGFELYYLIQNPNAAALQVDVTYLLPFGASPLVKRYTVAARSRLTIWVDEETIPPSLDKVLATTDVSAKVQVVAGGGPIIVERAMYYSVPNGPVYGAGHESAGVTEAQFQQGQNWFFAEGATGQFFDTYLLLSNPGTGVANVTATYLLTSGQTHTKTYTLSPQSRFTIWVDEEQIPEGSGVRPLQSVDVSTTLTSDVPVIAERSMWWPQGAWYEAHNAAGATTFGTKWGIAEGEIGGARNAQTFLLVANVGAAPAEIRVTLMTESGQTLTWPTGGATHALPPHSRYTVPIDASTFPGFNSQRFGAVVDSIGSPGQPIVVERANYYNVTSAVWSSGGAALASKLSTP